MTDTPMDVSYTEDVGQNTILPVLQSVLASEAVAFASIMDYSGWVKKGDKSVAVPRSDRLNVLDKSAATPLDSQALTFTADEVTLDKYKAVYTRLEDRAGIQAVPDVEARILEDMAKGMAEQWETDIIAEILLASSSGPDHQIGSDGYVLAALDILEAKRLLDVQKVPQGDRYMLLHPNQLKEVLQIDNFIQQQRYPQQQALLNGEIGMVYGFKCLMTALATADKACFYHRSHVGFGAQMDMNFEVQRAPLSYQAWDYSLSTLYGVTVLDSGRRGVVITVA